VIIAAGATLDPVQLLITQLGVGGIVIAIIILGYLWPKYAVMREFAQADERIKQMQALIDTLLASQKDVLPLLMEVDKRLIPMMDNTQGLLKRMETLLDRVEREWEWRERRGRGIPEEAPGRRGGGDYEDRRGGGVGEGPSRGDRPPNEAGT
jgi:hypothetical protein